jgi:mRNA interferase RelE/StbE
VSAPYRVEVSSAARRGLRSLPAKVAAAIVEFITGPLADNPQQRLSKPLRNELEGLRSARRGVYRAVSRIDEARHTVVIAAINHRAHIYRRRWRCRSWPCRVLCRIDDDASTVSILRVDQSADVHGR